MFRGPEQFLQSKKILLDFRTVFDEAERFKEGGIVKSQAIDDLKQYNLKLEAETGKLMEEVLSLEEDSSTCNSSTGTEYAERPFENIEENCTLDITDNHDDVIDFDIYTDNHDDVIDLESAIEDIQVVDFRVGHKKSPTTRCFVGPNLKLKDAEIRIKQLEREVKSLLEDKIKLLEMGNQCEKNKCEANDLIVKFGNMISEIRKIQNSSTARIHEIVQCSREESKSVLDLRKLENDRG